MEYIPILTGGTATTFGDLTETRSGLVGVSDGTVGLFAGGNDSSKLNTIDYVTIQTENDADDWGDLTQARTQLGACSNTSRAVFAGGEA